MTCQTGGEARRHLETEGVMGSGESSEEGTQRRWLLSSGGRPERTSDGDEGRTSAAEQRNQSERTGSDGEEGWGCAGGEEEKVTCEEERAGQSSYVTRL